MKPWPWMLATLVACGHAPPPAGPGYVEGQGPLAPAAPTYTITSAPAAVDDLARHSMTKHLDLTYLQAGTPSRLVIDEAFSCDLQTVIVDGGRPTRVAVMYPMQGVAVDVDGVVTRRADLEGKGYLLERLGDAELQGLHIDGTHVSADEAEVLRAHHLRLGRPSGMVPLVASRQWTIDQDVVLTPAELATYFNDPLEPDKTRGTTVRLIRVSDTELVFDVTGDVAVPTTGGGTLAWKSVVTMARDGSVVMSDGTGTGQAIMNSRKVAIELTQTDRYERQPAPTP